ncbi:hypothetical protein LCGC14_2170530 [marine sediment metagenome]|uniref:Uncharacterized protein n=1 Tax=marine sediment metagenome TaxID=412755 RepID=A0A0F9G2X1_9ZZZZ
MEYWVTVLVFCVCVVTIITGLVVLGMIFWHLWRYGLDPVIDSPGSAADALEKAARKRRLTFDPN